MSTSIQTTAPAPAGVAPPSSEDAWTDVAGVQALTCMSSSWIHDAVRAKRFPAPVLQRHRCTRWRVGDVLSWMRQQAQQQPTGNAAGAK